MANMTRRKPRIAVFFGGDPSTRDLSLETGHWASEHIPRSQYDVIPVHVNEQQQWQVPLGSLPQTGSMSRALEMLQAAVPALSPAQALPRLLSRSPDVFFTLLRGKGGDDGRIQTLAETVGVVAVGSGPLTCVTTADKQACARAVEAIALTPFAVPISQAAQALEAAADIREDFTFPLFVKPKAAEGSTGISRVERPEDLPAAIETAQEAGDILIQEEQRGTELSVTVFEDAAGRIRVLPPTIVQPMAATYFDSLAKRRAGRVKLLTAEADEPMTARAMEIAHDVYTALTCRGVVTIDMVAHDGDIDVLEVNTVPTATAHTPLLHQLKAAGIHPSQFVDSVVRGALEH